MDNWISFKNSFFFGRLIWATGEGDQKVVRVARMLRKCQIQSEEILSINALQFIDMISRGMPEALVEQYEVILVRDFEDLDASLAAAFLKSIQTMLDLQLGLNMRIVLVSGRQVPSELNDFAQLKPTLISLDNPSEDPGDINLRVHTYLEQAMRLSRIPVVRMSERAAVFIEYYSGKTLAADVIELLVLGLYRSDRRILRFKDLLPTLCPENEIFSYAEMRKNKEDWV